MAGQAGSNGATGDGGPAVKAQIYWPYGVWSGPNGTVYLADWNNHLIRDVDPSGNIHTLIGTIIGDTCTSITASTVKLDHPTDMKIGPDGNYYVAAWHDFRIKMFIASTGVGSCIVGTGSPTFGGDGGPASAASLNFPTSIVWDPAGNMYISDSANQRIRKVDTSGTIWTFAGSGAPGYANGVSTTAQFHFPTTFSAPPGAKIAINPSGTTLYVADSLNNVVRAIDIASANVTLFAGTPLSAGYSGDGGPATSAQLDSPLDVAVGPDGSVYVADTVNNVIRKIAPGGTISTVVGNGGSGFSPDGANAKQAFLNAPGAVWAAGTTGNVTLYIADTGNSLIRKVHNP